MYTDIRNKANLLLNINGNGFDTFVPLTSIKTEEDIQALHAKGYHCYPVFTVGTFAEKLPTVPVDKVFYTPSMSMGCLYFNAETLAISNINLIFLAEDGPASQNYISKIGTVIEETEQEAQNGDFSNYVWLDGVIQLEYVIKVLTEKTDLLKDPYSLFFDAYETSDYGFGRIDTKTLKKIVATKKPAQKAKTTRALKELPDEVAIYRGGNSESQPYDKAFSWSLDINIANFFASRLGSAGGYIATAKVKKSEIIEYIDGRGEEEVVVLPEDLYDVEVSEIFGLPFIEEAYRPIIPMYQKYREKIGKLEFAQDSEVHGKLHEQRVLLMSLLIADQLGLPSKDKKILAEAAVYHDTMRVDDSREESHGLASRKNYEKLEPHPLEEVGFLCEYHCKHDEVAYEEIRNNRQLSKNREKSTLLFNIFKDADALDRVRFGIKDLDLNHLRIPISKQLTLVARLNLEWIE